MNEVILEKEKLKQVIHDYEDYINDTKLELKNIRKLYPDPDVAEEKEKITICTVWLIILLVIFFFSFE